MDDNKQPIVDKDKVSDTPPAGDVPPVPPVPTDVPPLPPLSPDEVKVPTQPLPKTEGSTETSSVTDTEKVEEVKLPPVPKPVEKPADEALVAPEIPKPEALVEPKLAAEPMPVPQKPDEKVKDDTSTRSTGSVQASSAQGKQIEAPKKEEMPVEAEFPGQPLPETKQQDLEKKAKEMIDKDGGVKDRKVEVVGKPKGNVKKTLVGMLLFVLLGAGAFAGTRLVGQTTENRSQAGAGTDFCWCGSESDVCKNKSGIVYCCAPDYSGGAKCDKTSSTPGCTRSLYNCREDEIDIKCCDGTWININKDANKNNACSGHGGYDDPNKSNDCKNVPVTQCTCDSWSNACGVNCKFPTGTAAQAQQKADSLCKPVIAMCDPGTGKVSYEVFTNDHKCRGHVDVCKNPVAQPDCKEDPKQCNESCSSDADCDSEAGLVCDSDSGTCRDSNCPTSENCKCPEGDVTCDDLVCSGSALELGSSYTFTCNASVTGSKRIETYDFRYKKDDSDWAALPAASEDSNISSELFIGDPGSYVIECRACEDKNNKTTCTPYERTTAD